MDNHTKTVIMERLYERASVCSVCHTKICSHPSTRELPSLINRDDILYSINLDEHFYVESKVESGPVREE